MLTNLLENLRLVMTRKDKSCRQALNLPIYETIIMLLKMKNQKINFSLIINGQILSFLSNLILKHFNNLMTKTLNFRKKYLVLFLFPFKQSVRKSIQNRKINHKNKDDIKSNIDAVVKRCMDYSNPSQIQRMRTQQPFISKYQYVPQFKADGFKSAIKNIKKQELNEISLDSFNVIQYNSFVEQTPKISSFNIKYEQFMKQQLNLSSRLSRKQATLFVSQLNTEKKLQKTKRKRNNKKNHKIKPNQFNTTIDKKTRLSQVQIQTQMETQIQIQTQHQKNVINQINQISLINFPSLVQSLFMQISQLCNISNESFMLLKQMKITNTSSLFKNDWQQSNTKMETNNIILNQLFEEHTYQQNTDDNQEFIAPPLFQIKQQSRTPIQIYINKWKQLQIKVLQTNDTLLGQKSLNFNKYCFEQNLNRFEKADIFHKILQSDFKLQQKNPKQFSDISITSRVQTKTEIIWNY